MQPRCFFISFAWYSRQCLILNYFLLIKAPAVDVFLGFISRDPLALLCQLVRFLVFIASVFCVC